MWSTYFTQEPSFDYNLVRSGAFVKSALDTTDENEFDALEH